jgi:hypothetical protein
LGGKEIKPVENLHLAAANSSYFPSLLGPDEKTLTYVGFAGEGTVDDLVVTKNYNQTVLDFTYTIKLADGVSSVTYTIGSDEPVTITAETVVEDIAKDSTIVVTAEAKDWYKITAGTGTYAVTADETITVEAAKTADVTTDSEGNVKIEVTENTKPADVGVKTGSFAAADTKPAELNKALTWATSKGGAAASAAGALVGQLDFTDETETATEQAYLLNCAPTEDAIKAKKDAFVFSAFTFDENGAPVVTVDPEFAGDVNGRIEIRGATSLDAEDAFTAPKKDGDAFFKAFLVK